MIVGVADTHTALWHLFADSKLSRTAEDFIQAAAARRDKVAAYEDLLRALKNPAHVFTEAALTAEVVQSMWQVSRAEVPDMPDRIVAATAIYFKVPVFSRDGRIRSANLQTVW